MEHNQQNIHVPATPDEQRTAERRALGTFFFQNKKDGRLYCAVRIYDYYGRHRAILYFDEEQRERAFYQEGVNEEHTQAVNHFLENQVEWQFLLRTMHDFPEITMLFNDHIGI